MAILPVFHTIVNRKLELQIRIGIVARIISVLFCAVLRTMWLFLCCSTSHMAFSVLFYVGYGIFCAVLRRIWHTLCCFTPDTALSVLFYVGYGIFDENVSLSKDSY
jgi:hypothetical protein